MKIYQVKSVSKDNKLINTKYYWVYWWQSKSKWIVLRAEKDAKDMGMAVTEIKRID